MLKIEIVLEPLPEETYNPEIVRLWEIISDIDLKRFEIFGEEIIEAIRGYMKSRGMSGKFKSAISVRSYSDFDRLLKLRQEAYDHNRKNIVWCLKDAELWDQIQSLVDHPVYGQQAKEALSTRNDS